MRRLPLLLVLAIAATGACRTPRTTAPEAVSEPPPAAPAIEPAPPAAPETTAAPAWRWIGAAAPGYGEPVPGFTPDRLQAELAARPRQAAGTAPDQGLMAAAAEILERHLATGAAPDDRFTVAALERFGVPDTLFRLAVRETPAGLEGPLALNTWLAALPGGPWNRFGAAFRPVVDGGPGKVCFIAVSRLYDGGRIGRQTPGQHRLRLPAGRLRPQAFSLSCLGKKIDAGRPAPGGTVELRLPGGACRYLVEVAGPDGGTVARFAILHGVEQPPEWLAEQVGQPDPAPVEADLRAVLAGMKEGGLPDTVFELAVLSDHARAHAAEMLARNYRSPADLEGRLPADRLKLFGLSASRVDEFIVTGARPEALAERLREMAELRQALAAGGFSHIGLGVAAAEGGGDRLHMAVVDLTVVSDAGLTDDQIRERVHARFSDLSIPADDLLDRLAQGGVERYAGNPDDIAGLKADLLVKMQQQAAPHRRALFRIFSLSSIEQLPVRPEFTELAAAGCTGVGVGVRRVFREGSGPKGTVVLVLCGAGVPGGTGGR